MSEELKALYGSWLGESMNKEQWIAFLSSKNTEALDERIMHLVAERDTLRARIAELEEAQRWIPVGEALPEDEGWEFYERHACLVNWYGDKSIGYFHFHNDGWYDGRFEVTKHIEAWRKRERVQL